MANILIVEDDLQFKTLLEIRLKSILNVTQINHVATIQAAKDFLNSNKKSDIDLVILDQHLPDGRGVDLLESGLLSDLAVLAVSSDDNPEIPGANLKLGATYFLGKTQLNQPLFKPLIHAVLERSKLEKELAQAKINHAVMESIKTLVSTLRHEINNPLGAVLGGAYLLKSLSTHAPEQKEAADLVEQSGKRIKHVLDEIIKAASLEETQKADTTVFQIPGDPKWK